MSNLPYIHVPQNYTPAMVEANAKRLSLSELDDIILEHRSGVFSTKNRIINTNLQKIINSRIEDDGRHSMVHKDKLNRIQTTINTGQDKDLDSVINKLHNILGKTNNKIRDSIREIKNAKTKKSSNSVLQNLEFQKAFFEKREIVYSDLLERAYDKKKRKGGKGTQKRKVRRNSKTRKSF
jgi:hypothetical protein